MEWFNIVMRLLHVLSAIFLLGGGAFALFGLLPATRLINDDLREQILTTARRKYYRFSHAAITLLIITGAYNWWLNTPEYRDAEGSTLIQALLGTKALLGIVIAVILFGQAFGVIKAKQGGDTKLMVALGIIIVIMATIIRQVRIAG